MPNTFDLLRRLVEEMRGPENWTFRMEEEDGALRFVIRVPGIDTYDHTRPRVIDHWHPVPTTTYNERSWKRWLFDRCMGTAYHEMGEWVRWGKERPFAPLHGPGENPYVIHEYRDPIDRRTLQDGTIAGS